MFKKLTVLAMAVGVVAAFAIPASAGAAWRDKGVDINENVQVGLTGNARFQGGLGGVECQVTSRVQFQPGTTGVAETFTPHPTSDTTNCKGLGGLAFCQIHNLTPTGVSPHGSGWVIHTTGTQTIAITVGDIHSTATGGFCPLERITLTGATVTAHGEQVLVSDVQLSGTLTADLQTKGQQSNPHLFNGPVDQEQVTVSGTLQIENAAQRGTYEI